MKILFLLLSLAFILTCRSQAANDIETPEGMETPNPYHEYLKFMDNDVPLNQVKSISRIHINPKASTIDTMSTKYLTKDGLLHEQLNYRNNKPTDSVIYTYNANNKVTQWISYDKYNTTTLKYYYTTDDIIQKLDKTTIHLKKTAPENVSKTNITYTYKDGLLQERLKQELNYANQVTSTFFNRYTYEKRKPVMQNSSVFDYTYTYTAHGKLHEINEYLHTGTGKVYKKKIFNYDEQGRLIRDSLSYGKDLDENKFQIAEYKYKGSSSDFESIKATYEDYYRNATFIYNDQNQLIEVQIETNLRSTSKLKLFIHGKADYFPYPIKYREVFEYDQYGNIKSNKKYANGQFIYEVAFYMTYW